MISFVFSSWPNVSYERTVLETESRSQSANVLSSPNETSSINSMDGRTFSLDIPGAPRLARRVEDIAYSWLPPSTREVWADTLKNSSALQHRSASVSIASDKLSPAPYQPASFPSPASEESSVRLETQSTALYQPAPTVSAPIKSGRVMDNDAPSTSSRHISNNIPMASAMDRQNGSQESYNSQLPGMINMTEPVSRRLDDLDKLRASSQRDAAAHNLATVRNGNEVEMSPEGVAAILGRFESNGNIASIGQTAMHTSAQAPGNERVMSPASAAEILRDLALADRRLAFEDTSDNEDEFEGRSRKRRRIAGNNPQQFTEARVSSSLHLNLSNTAPPVRTGSSFPSGPAPRLYQRKFDHAQDEIAFLRGLPPAHYSYHRAEDAMEAAFQRDTSSNSEQQRSVSFSSHTISPEMVKSSHIQTEDNDERSQAPDAAYYRDHQEYRRNTAKLISEDQKSTLVSAGDAFVKPDTRWDRQFAENLQDEENSKNQPITRSKKRTGTYKESHESQKASGHVTKGPKPRATTRKVKGRIEHGNGSESESEEEDCTEPGEKGDTEFRARGAGRRKTTAGPRKRPAAAGRSKGRGNNGKGKESATQRNQTEIQRDRAIDTDGSGLNPSSTDGGQNQIAGVTETAGLMTNTGSEEGGQNRGDMQELVHGNQDGSTQVPNDGASNDHRTAQASQRLMGSQSKLVMNLTPNLIIPLDFKTPAKTGAEVRK